MTQPVGLVPGYPFGTDLNQVTLSDGSIDLDPGMGETSGRTLFVQRCIRRVTAWRGSVVDAPNDCLDLRSFLRTGAMAQSAGQIQSAFQAEMMKEAGVTSAQVGVTFSVSTSTLTIQMQLGSSYGPLQLTFALSPGNITILLDGLPVGF
jgi:hypothetical protein